VGDDGGVEARARAKRVFFGLLRVIVDAGSVVSSLGVGVGRAGNLRSLSVYACGTAATTPPTKAIVNVRQCKWET
jgi:hypothetical protein